MAFKISNVNIIDDSRNILNALAVGIGTTNPTSKLYVVGDGYFTGVTTASRFSSNVSQGTAPISVASSTLVSNLNANYLNDQPGSYYQIANNLTGQVPAGAIVQSNGFTVNGNLNVSGNVSVGGSSFILNSEQLRISDKDITLGVTTDANGNDISTDVTANHGGIAIASTEGSPIINIPYQAGINTDPSTYKQLMWIKQGNYSGMGTDAWVFNYAVSIGNTATVQNLSRLTVGAGFTVFDTYLDATDIRARNITATGIITASSFVGNGSQLTNVTATSVGTLAQLSVTGVSTFTGAIDANGGADISGGETVLSSATVSDLTAGRVVLAGTSGALQDSTNLTFSGAGLIVGAGGINVTGISTFSTDLVVGGDIKVGGNDILASDGATNITLTSSTLTTFAGDIKVTGNDIQSSSATAITLSGADVTVAGDLTVTGNDIKASGGNTNITLTSNTLTTFAGDIKVGGNDIQASDGTVAITLAGNNVTVAGDLTVTGISTAATYYVGATKVLDTVNSQVSLVGIATLDATTKATLERELAFAPNEFNSLNVSGISTLQSTTLIGGGTSTGTAGQVLQVTGISSGAYIGGNLGIGSLTPTSRLDIIGDVKVVGIITASDFNSNSDIKLKTNIQRITNPIEKVLQINGVSFNWKESGKATIGVIAQEVEAVLPELVSDTNPKSVNYNGLIGLLIECVKDQQRQIDELKNIT